MNTHADEFDLHRDDDTPVGERPTPTPPRPGGVLHQHSGGREEAAKPPSRRAARRKAAAPTPKEPASGLPFPFRSGFLLVLGALVLAVLWAGGLFGGGGDWPWKLFQTEGGAVTFTWDAAHVFTLLGAFFAVFFLLTPFGPAIPSRGATVLTVAALALVIFPPLTLGDRTAALMGLAAAALFSREGLRDGIGARGFLFVALLLLGVSLFFPIPEPGGAYDAQALAIGRDLFVDGSFGDVIQQPLTAMVVCATLVFLLALLSWIGIGGRWSVWAGGVFLLLGVLGPLVLAWIGSDGACVTCHEGLSTIAGGLPADYLAFTLPVTAGALDASRS
mgnify:CR=1 FL=1